MIQNVVIYYDSDEYRVMFVDDTLEYKDHCMSFGGYTTREQAIKAVPELYFNIQGYNHRKEEMNA